MKLEIHIPELAELNTNVRQLIDTLNDLAVVGINAVKREPAPVIEESPAPAPALVAEVEPEKPKRTRKAKAEEPNPAPDNGTGAEVITYTVAEPQPEAAPAVKPESEQPVATEPEAENTPTYVLADCTALSPKLQTAGKLDEAKAWLKKHGADRLKDLDPSHYGAFITFAKGLLG